jgi:RNA polymerase sigma-70 factor (ECF subfamily)
VHRFAVWLSGNRAEAEDIVSETFLRLWGSLDELQVETLKGYLLTIARNVFISQRRKSGRFRSLETDLSDNSQPPDAEAEGKDEMRVLKTAVDTLPEGERAAFLMRIQQGISYQEIARSLGISLAAAKVRVHRARVKLASYLSDEQGNP